MLVGEALFWVSWLQDPLWGPGAVAALLVGGVGSPSGWLISLGHVGTDAYWQVGR